MTVEAAIRSTPHPAQPPTTREPDMPATCTVCVHPQRAEIERAVLDGLAMRAVARQYDLGRDSVARHSRNGHVPLALTVGADRREAAHAADLTSRAEELWARASQILADVEGAPLLELAAVRELRAVIDLLARLAGPPLAPDGPIVISLRFPEPNAHGEGAILPLPPEESDR